MLLSFLVLIDSRKKAPAVEASPDDESSDKIIKTEPDVSGLFLDSTPHKGKKIKTTATVVSSDEEEIMTLTPKAKSTLANRKAASTPSKTKPYVLKCLVSLLCLDYFL